MNPLTAVIVDDENLARRGLARLQADTLPMIVFVTAYDEYAVDAFKVHAVDYILKPVVE